MDRTRVLIADDHPVVREGFRTMLSTDQAIEVVGEASDGAETVTMVAEKRPDVILMDIRMPNMDGIEATRQIKDQHPSISVIVLTMYDSDAYVIDAVRAGASGYLLKDTSRELLLHTIRTVSSGATLIKTDLLYEAICSLIPSGNGYQKSVASASGSVDALTPREQDVLKLVVDGCTNKEIGKELGITEDTVKKHMQSILAKLHEPSRARIIAKATRAGIVN